MVNSFSTMCTDSTFANQAATGNQWCFDRENRNIVYENNGWLDTPELVDNLFVGVMIHGVGT